MSRSEHSVHSFVVDQQVKPFIKTERHDITAADAPSSSANRFEVMRFTAPKNQVIVIKSIIPFVCRRTDVGNVTLESFQYIPSIEANGFFGWEPTVDNKSPFVIESDINAPRISAGPLLDTDRIRFPGLTHVADDPHAEMFKFKDNVFSIEVRGSKTFKVTMSVLGVGIASGIPNPFRIGSDATGAQKRVDFAGVSVFGVTMPEQLYNDIRSNWSVIGVA